MFLPSIQDFMCCLVALRIALCVNGSLNLKVACINELEMPELPWKTLFRKMGYWSASVMCSFFRQLLKVCLLHKRVFTKPLINAFISGLPASLKNSVVSLLVNDSCHLLEVCALGKKQTADLLGALR